SSSRAVVAEQAVGPIANTIDSMQPTVPISNSVWSGGEVAMQAGKPYASSDLGPGAMLIDAGLQPGELPVMDTAMQYAEQPVTDMVVEEAEPLVVDAAMHDAETSNVASTSHVVVPPTATDVEMEAVAPASLGIEVEEGSQMDAGTGTRREEPLAAGNAATQNEEPGNGDANVSLGFHNGLASGTPFVDPGVVASMLLGLGINGTAEMTLVNPSNGLDMPPELSSGPVANAMLLSVGTAANVLPDLGVSGAAEVPPVNSGTTEDPHTAVRDNNRVVHGRSTSHVHRHKRQSSRRHTPYDRVSQHSKKTAKKTLAKQAAEIVALCSSDVATCVPPSSSDCDAALASSASGSERAAKPVVDASSADIPAGVGASVQPLAPAMSSREDDGGGDI
ncbi:hypothetical protein GGH91_005751, partial [Coemansia sp. RSA 2671]